MTGVNLLNISNRYNLDCTEYLQCLRCNANGCTKCAKFIMQDSKLCVDSCPSRYLSQWSNGQMDLMGRICVRANNFSTPLQSLMIGCFFGAILCFLILLFGIIIFRRKHQRINRKSIKHQLIKNEYDKLEFLRQLDELRPFADYFLVVLNDTRKEIRSLHMSGDTNVLTKFYPMIRDLAKILIILNRPAQLIEGPPQDWSRLLQWAERILANYKSNKTGTLVEFYQSEFERKSDKVLISKKNTSFKSLFYSTPMVQSRRTSVTSSFPSSFNIKAPNRNNNSTHISDLFNSNNENFEPAKDEKSSRGSLISLQDFIQQSNATSNNKQEHFSNYYGENFEHIKEYLSKGSLLVVEDELIEFKLGLRPQDEIITEL